MNKNYHIIYHTDLDGYASAAVIKKFLKQYKLAFNNVFLYPYNYGQPMPKLLSNRQNDEIFIVDISYQPWINQLINKYGKNISWIDHHKNSIEYLEENREYLNSCNYSISNRNAACILTWKYLFSNKNYIPEILLRLGAYDIWNKEAFDWDEQLALQLGFSKQIAKEQINTIKYLLTNEPITNSDIIKSIIEQGRLILEYENKRKRHNIKNSSYEAVLSILEKKYTAIALNTQTCGSTQFELTKTDTKDLMLVYKHVKGKDWTVSIYTNKDNIDCCEIAKHFGGGGHPKASGFQISTEELFKILKPSEK